MRPPCIRSAAATSGCLFPMRPLYLELYRYSVVAWVAVPPKPKGPFGRCGWSMLLHDVYCSIHCPFFRLSLILVRAPLLFLLFSL